MRTKRLSRCETCGLSEGLCLCSALPFLSPQLRVVIVAHRAELAKPTNTAKLCARMLSPRAELLRSDALGPHGWSMNAANDTWVLFPSEDAVPIEQVRTRVKTLIVPDGTWAQARRIARRHPGCSHIPKVRLADPPPSTYRLRRYRDHTGLCTLEAVAHALGSLEGPSHQHQLLVAFQTWVERALLVRAGAHLIRGVESFGGTHDWLGPDRSSRSLGP